MADAPPAGTGHAAHDEQLIAALLDPDVSDDERVAAEALVGTCSDCASLLADLATLARASAALPAPVRTRDFRLTAADAAKLGAAPAGEPHPSTTRLTGEMQHPKTDHGTHDQLAIAALLDRSMPDADRERAEALMASCDECAGLHGDLVALRVATRALPTPGRPRDFSLSHGDVERLRQSGWRRLIAAIGSPRDILSRPLAIGLTTLGLAGLLVATLPGALSGQAGAAPTVLSTVGQAVGGGDANPGALGPSRESATSAGPSPAAAAAAAPAAPAAAAASAGPSAAAALVAPSSAPSVGRAPLAPVPSGSSFDTMAAGPVASASPEASSGAAAIAPPSPEPTDRSQDAYGSISAASTPAEPAGERPGLLVAATLLLGLGLGLFGLRWAARRLGSA